MAANMDGSATPRSLVMPPLPDTTALKTHLAVVAGTMNAIGPTFDTLNEQSRTAATLSPTMPEAAQQIRELHRQIKTQDEKQNNRILKVKDMVRNKLKDQLVENMKPQIEEQVKTEITRQTAIQVELQINDHLPVSLQEQLAESQKQYKEVRCSLVNSEARRTNSVLRIPRDLAEPLEHVLKSDGEKSSHFPADLNTLFSYDLDTSKKLARDFRLPYGDTREINLNKFLSHIGIEFSLVPVPAVRKN